MEPATPSRGKKATKPAMRICNRCIPYLNADLTANPCITKGDFGPLGEKCQRCQDSRHFCVPVEPPLYQHLQAAVTAREALARARRRGEANQAELADEARDAGLELTAALKRFDRNRNKTAGDRPAPRKKAAAASQGGSNELIVNELQSIRRAMLALVEVGKSFLRLRFAQDELLDPINAALGVDAPASPSERPSPSPVPSNRAGGDEDEEEEEEEQSSAPRGGGQRRAADAPAPRKTTGGVKRGREDSASPTREQRASRLRLSGSLPHPRQRTAPFLETNSGEEEGPEEGDDDEDGEDNGGD